VPKISKLIWSDDDQILNETELQAIEARLKRDIWRRDTTRRTLDKELALAARADCRILLSVVRQLQESSSTGAEEDESRSDNDPAGATQGQGYQEGLYRGLLLGARELCIFCANNHPVEPDDQFIPSYVHTFPGGSVYVCAASSIWLAGGYKLK
jgi:hypothetical protein